MPPRIHVDHRYADIDVGGGVRTWIQSLMGHPDPPFDLALNEPRDRIPADRSRWVVHLHDHRRAAWLDEYSRARDLGAALVTTVHNHAPYCPSQSKYFERLGRPCPIPMSRVACSASRYLMRCGRRNPIVAAAEYRRTRSVLDVLRSGRIQTLVYTEFVRRQLLNQGVPADALGFAPIPMVPADWPPPAPPPEGPPRLLFTGRLSADKGLAWLLDALAASGPDVVLDVAGSGDDEPRVREHAHELGLGHRVVFHGWVDARGIRDLLARSWAAVVPSQWHEPAGIVTLEAHLAGRPVIASRVGGIPELAREGRSALLVEPGDVAGLAAAIDRLCRDGELRERLGVAGRDDVLTEHTRDRLVQVLERTYRRALERRGPPAGR